FSDESSSQLISLTPYFAAAVAIMSQQMALEGLLDSYLGHQAGKLVRSGQYRRGDGKSIDSVIWFSDLRGFTSFTDQHSVEETLKRLNRSFDLVGKSICDHGGEILKFIGDAILAVFPVSEERDKRAAAEAAVAAAQKAIQSLDGEVLEGQEPIRVGVGLHNGIVTFGNVGTTSRLDFTVIGGPVNEAARLASMCKQLNQDILLTDSIACLLPEYSLHDLGEHILRGVANSRRLYGVPLPL
ncbi:adenylate/guanylate cyclase domain-containing protein, partial [bacterium]|nr:adenylate/guanylate cyclase domain-containing protein [bacterium]